MVAFLNVDCFLLLALVQWNPHELQQCNIHFALYRLNFSFGLLSEQSRGALIYIFFVFMLGIVWVLWKLIDCTLYSSWQMLTFFNPQCESDSWQTHRQSPFNSSLSSALVSGVLGKPSVLCLSNTKQQIDKLVSRSLWTQHKVKP